MVKGLAGMVADMNKLIKWTRDDVHQVQVRKRNLQERQSFSIESRWNSLASMILTLTNIPFLCLGRLCTTLYLKFLTWESKN
ncbi:hypothetical protein P692DRAFT_20886584 [Suillus brevipes Sb2]|nr:hypothetical protein P692DRAFT_20886584 [Suillus brevipes Sb2]